MIVRMDGMGGDLADAWKNLKGQVTTKVTGVGTDLERAERALKIAAYCSLGALVLSGLAAWGTWRKKG